MASERVVSIQWLRAVAATLVVVTHAADMIEKGRAPVNDAFVPAIPNLGAFGSSGVDLFFVISGFVMAQTLSVWKADAPRFLAARWLRIVPLFAAVSLVYTALAIDPVTLRSVAMSITVLPVFDGLDYHRPVLFVGWTLAFEFTFYALVAVALAVDTGHRRVRALLAMTLAVAVLGMSVHPGWAPLRILFNPLQFEFAFGILVWIAWQRGITARLAPAAMAVGVMLLLTGLAFGLGVPLSAEIEAAVDGSSSLARVWTWGMPWTLIVIGLVDTVPRRGAETLVARIGDASYSTYLVHPCVIALLFAARAHVPTLSAALYVGLMVVISSVVGLIVHTVIEVPLLRRLKRGTDRGGVAALLGVLRTRRAPRVPSTPSH